MSKIYIDAGHGGKDPGATNGSRHESADTLKMSLAVRDLLVAQEHTVLMARTTDEYVSLATRTTQANNAAADIFVSIHRNSFTNNTANGVEIWVYTTAGAVEVGAATEVLEHIAAAGIQSNRGVKKGNYHVCRESKMPAMLIELGFISNAKDNSLFDDNFTLYAKAIAQGVCAALGVEYTDANAGTTEPRQLARIQLGAYTYPDNEAGARADLEKIRALGLEAFLVIPEEAKANQ